MRLMPYKCFKILTIVPRWSTVLPLLFYLVFISVILHMTFPLRSSKSSDEIPANEAKRLDVNALVAAETDDGESKLQEKAKLMGVIDNANEILGDVFRK